MIGNILNTQFANHHSLLGCECYQSIRFQAFNGCMHRGPAHLQLRRQLPHRKHGSCGELTRKNQTFEIPVSLLLER